jgi:prevent-host-death family protein
MKIASVAEIKSQFSSFLKASAAGPIVVTRNGRPVAVILGVQDEDEIERLLMAYSPRLQAILEASRKQIREGDVLGHAEFWAEVEASRVPKRREAGRRPTQPMKVTGPASRLLETQSPCSRPGNLSLSFRERGDAR